MQRLSHLLNLLRQVLGEGEYERYRDHVRRRHPEVAPVGRREFYVARLEEKYSRPQRCC